MTLMSWYDDTVTKIPSFQLVTPWEVGKEFRRLRHAAGLSQSQLAKAAGVSRQWLVKLEKGHRRAELGKITALMRALNAHMTITTTEPETQD